jgi:hypothetical protein
LRIGTLSPDGASGQPGRLSYVWQLHLRRGPLSLTRGQWIFGGGALVRQFR